MLRKTFLLLLALLPFCVISAKKNKATKPNVILIVVDDQGYGDVACLGNEFIKTPNMDELYDKSVRFTDYHVSPTCAPTRASLMTGHHSNRAGVWHTVNGRSLILEREKSIAEIFNENDYNTAMFGKWHLGDYYPFRPQDKGFKEVLGHNGGGIGQTTDHFDNDYFNDTYLHNGVSNEYEGYCTDIWFDNAIEYIDENQDKPFFCYLSTNAAHSPYFVEEKYAAPYRDNDAIPNPAFYGMITNIDENMGKLFEHLEEKDMLDNTIIIFTTDNGSAAGAKVTGHRLDGFVVKGNNAGMRGIKASMYEGGHRVPLFIHWKDGKIVGGKDVNELTAHYDILPTLVDLCDLTVAKDNDFDGKSLVPLMKGDTEDFENRIVITNSQRNERPEAWRRTALMQGDWRLINGKELYDLSTDPEQRKDISANHPEKMAEFRTYYDAWWDKTSPSHNDQPNIIVGNDNVNPVTLYCHDWHTVKVSPWNQKMIRMGYRDNGYWMLKVEQDGKYRLRLRRWPEELDLPLNATVAPRPALPNTTVTASKKGKSLTIVESGISIQNNELTTEVDPSDNYVEFTVDLLKGETTLKTWFTLDTKEEIGAYYVSVEKL